MNLKGEKALKARIPVKLKKEAMAEINRLADREYQKVKDKEIADAPNRTRDNTLRFLPYGHALPL